VLLERLREGVSKARWRKRRRRRLWVDEESEGVWKSEILS
jgi:hypothetical protein